MKATLNWTIGSDAVNVCVGVAAGSADVNAVGTTDAVIKDVRELVEVSDAEAVAEADNDADEVTDADADEEAVNEP